MQKIATIVAVHVHMFDVSVSTRQLALYFFFFFGGGCAYVLKLVIVSHYCSCTVMVM